MTKPIYYLLILTVLTAGCGSKQEIDDFTPSNNHSIGNHRISSRSAQSASDSSPFDFGAKIYCFEETRWVHHNFDSYQLIPLQTEYNAIAAIIDEPQIYNCAQFRFNVYRRAYECQYSFYVTLISETEESFDSYISNNIFCKNVSTSSGFSGYEIFIDILTHNVVAAIYYENGVLSQAASLYDKSRSLEDNTDDINDILYGLGIHSDLNTGFDYSKAFPEVGLYRDIVHHEDCSYSIMELMGKNNL